MLCLGKVFHLCGCFITNFYRCVTFIASDQVGCWAGNFMMQHAFPDFPSDLVPPFDVVGASLLIGNSSNGLQWFCVNCGDFIFAVETE